MCSIRTDPHLIFPYILISDRNIPDSDLGYQSQIWDTRFRSAIPDSDLDLRLSVARFLSQFFTPICQIETYKHQTRISFRHKVFFFETHTIRVQRRTYQERNNKLDVVVYFNFVINPFALKFWYIKNEVKKSTKRNPHRAIHFMIVVGI